MDIVVLCDYDAAGNMYSLCSGVNRYTEHNALLVKLRVHPVAQYPSMMVANEENIGAIRRAVYDADAVVFKEFWWIPEKLGLDMDKVKSKPKVALFGGGGFRFEKNRKSNLAFFNSHNAKIATSSADFLQTKRDMAWIPPCVRYEELRERYDYSKTTPPLVFASPSRDTDLRLKLRKNFTETMKSLKQERLIFESMCPSSAEKMIPNRENLELKAHASIFFDRIYDIYGVNSQEAATFEAAVITGTSHFALQRLTAFGFRCPFMIVRNYVEAKEAVRRLLTDRKYRQRKAEECRRYAETLHSGRESAKRLIALLET